MLQEEDILLVLNVLNMLAQVGQVAFALLHSTGGFPSNQQLGRTLAGQTNETVSVQAQIPTCRELSNEEHSTKHEDVDSENVSDEPNQCEEPPKKVPRRWNYEKVEGDEDSPSNFFQHLQTCDERSFIHYTRMGRNQYEQLCKLVKPFLIKTSYRLPLSVPLRVAMALKYLAHGGTLRALSQEFQIGLSTASNVVPETCIAIWNALNPTYMSQPSIQKWREIATGFWETWNFPNCVGAVDVKQIKVKAQARTGTTDYFSLIILAACDANYNFIWVDVGTYGSEGESAIFSESKFGRMIQSKTLNLPPPESLPGTDTPLPFAFVGDSGFPIKECIMRPYPGRNVQRDCATFNVRLSRARRTIENTFAIFASRWQIFNQQLATSQTTVESCIRACACIHNFILASDKAHLYLSRKFCVSEDNKKALRSEKVWRREVTRHIDNIGRIGSNMARREVYSQRDLLKDYFVSPEGEVEWQDAVVDQEKRVRCKRPPVLKLELE